jgi:hypothetical protein
MADAIDRNAETQNLYREVNERVAEVNRRFAKTAADSPDQLIEIFCECGHQGPCAGRVTVTPATYERVRSDPTAFLLLPGHGEASVENVIERGDGYLITRNFGEAADIARAGDPRRRP